ncbi:MAG: STAS domain-containing protein [Herpetosiphonaceae bacterium]|nr:STAS domain-containing protein [Herpetosiphonaceae bacterium]
MDFYLKTATQRPRTLFITAAILAVGAVADLPLALNNQSSTLLVPLLIGVVVVSVVVMWLAYRGWLMLGGILLSTTIFIAVALSSDAESMLYGPVGTAFIFPILIAGLVLGANAVLIFGTLGIATIIITTLSSNLVWTSSTSLITAILVLSTMLLWLTISLLQSNLNEADRQRQSAETAEAQSRASALSLQEMLRNLEQRNAEITQLYETVNNLEIPVIPLMDGIIVVPLVGHLDTQRMERLADHVLKTIHQERVRIILIDITAVPVFDTAVAQRLASLTTAVQLLGAKVILTGIRVETAITITSLGITFDSISTFSRLQQGIEVVLMGNTARN